jgi:hypothetical protein
MDYETVERGVIDADLAGAWGTPAMAGRAFVTCRPASGAEAFLRMVEGVPPAGYRPLRTYGWAALEICVSDTLAVAERLRGSPFEIIGPPRELDGMPEIFPMQVRGPDDEIVFLTQIRGQLAGMRLPTAERLIDRLFILVLACSDLAATRAWVSTGLGLVAHPEIAMRYTMLSKAFGLDADTRHRIATGGHEIDSFLEFDQYPPQAEARPCDAGALPPGVALATLEHPDLDAISALWLSPPAARGGAIYGDRRHGVLSGPDGTLLELVSST